MEDKLFHFFIYKLIFYFLKCNGNIEEIYYFFIWKTIKFPKFNNLENLWNSEKLSNTLSVQLIKKKKKKTENKFVNKIIE